MPPGIFDHTCEGALHMERDLLIMIYGGIMGVVGSIVTSFITAIFQIWLERREYDRRQSEELSRQLRKIHLPTNEEVRIINADQHNNEQAETAHTAAEAGSILISILLTSALVYQTRDPMLGFAFGACLGFLITGRITKFIRG